VVFDTTFASWTDTVDVVLFRKPTASHIGQ
jgi:hypothetical protein